MDKPAPTGDVFEVKTHVGALLVVEPLEDVPPMMTSASKEPTPSVRCHIYVIAPPGQVVEEYHDALLFQSLLYRRLRQSLGKQVCGILTGSPGQVVNGRNVPYDLADPPDVAFEAANRAMMSRPQAQQQQQPATQAQGPWGQPAGAPAGSWGPPANQPQVQQHWGGTPPQPQQGPWTSGVPQPQQPWGQQPPGQQQGPPPGWGQQPAQQPQQGPWGQPPAPAQQWGQQQLPTPTPADEGVPPWEQTPAQQPAWGGQQ